MSGSADKNISDKYSEYVKRAWIVFAGIVFNIFVFIFLVQINFLWLFGDMPGLDQLENPSTDLPSEIYSSDNVLLGKFYRQNRSPVEYEKISPNVINALIATEDIRFYKHSGIDLKAMFAIFYYMLKGDQRGSSTLTQQLAKNLFKTRGASSEGVLGNIPGLGMLIIKTKEWITAIGLERNYTKKEIINLYLNTVDFGNNSFGIKVAAKTYFNISQDSLSVPQAAMLIGMLKATSLYSPITKPANALNRRNVVLKLMAENKMFTEAEAEKYSSAPLDLDFHVEDPYEGAAAYFRSVLNKELLSWCKENNHDIYGDGLKIYTTIDSKIQEHAEESVEQHMKVIQKRFYDHWRGKNPWVYENKKEIPHFLEDAAKKTDTYKMLKAKYGAGNDSIRIGMNTPVKMKIFSWKGERDTMMSPMDSLRYYKYFLHTGFMTMDPNTGEIKSWVGGINYKYFKYDHVKQGKRQPGSAFKPFVYTTAIDKGYNPCYLLPDVPVTFRYEENGEQKTWSPKNADWIFTGDTMTLRTAMARSINSVAAQVMKIVGPEEVIRYARRLGITSPLKPVPSLCLGSSDVSVFEMTGAYSAFVNSGVWIEPYYVSRIEDRNGNVIFEHKLKTRDALNEQTAYAMVHMLRGGTEERGGTSQALFQYNVFSRNEVGGKTGTTSNHSDGWFMGVTKGLVGGVWVGGEDRCIHFRTSALGEGSKIALPIFGIFLEKVYADTSLNVARGTFKRPKHIAINLHCPQRPLPPLRDSTEMKAGEVVDELKLK